MRYLLVKTAPKMDQIEFKDWSVLIFYDWFDTNLYPANHHW